MSVRVTDDQREARMQAWLRCRSSYVACEEFGIGATPFRNSIRRDPRYVAGIAEMKSVGGWEEKKHLAHGVKEGKMWTETGLMRIRELRLAGHSYGDIGHMLGCGKNAAIRQARGLIARGLLPVPTNPRDAIRPTITPPVPPVPRAPRNTLPPFPLAVARPVPPRPVQRAPEPETVYREPVDPLAPVAPTVPPMAGPLPYTIAFPRNACQWIVDDRVRPVLMCAQPVAFPTCPWCVVHRRVAYGTVRRADQGEMAA